MVDIKQGNDTFSADKGCITFHQQTNVIRCNKDNMFTGTNTVRWIVQVTVMTLTHWAAQSTEIYLPSLSRDDSATTTTAITVRWLAPTVPVDSYALSIKIPYASSFETRSISSSSARVAEFQGLNPGTSYTLCLAEITGDTRSADQCIYTGTRPDVPARISHVLGSPDEDTLTLDVEPPTIGNYNFIKARISGQPDSEQSLWRSAMKPFLFTDLSPCTLYTIIVTVEFVDLLSDTTTVQINTRPSPPSMFGSSSLTPTSITLQWVEADNNCTTYRLRYSVTGGEALTEVDGVVGSSYILEGLQTATQYTIYIHTVGFGKDSNATSTTVTTLAEARAPPHLNVSSIESDGIRAHWTTFGDESYTYTLTRDGRTTPEVRGIINTTETFLSQLEPPGATYTFCVTAGEVEWTNGSICGTFTLRPASVLDLSAQVVNSSVAEISWRTDLTSVQQGFDVSFASQDLEANHTYASSVNRSPFHLHNLYPGAMYTFVVKAISQGVTSDERAVSCVMPPLSPQVQCTPNESYIEVIITTDRSLVDEYIITCSGQSCPDDITLLASDEEVKTNIQYFPEDVKFILAVTSRRQNVKSAPVIKECFTSHATAKNVPMNIVIPVATVTAILLILAFLLVGYVRYKRSPPKDSKDASGGLRSTPGQLARPPTEDMDTHEYSRISSYVANVNEGDEKEYETIANVAVDKNGSDHGSVKSATDHPYTGLNRF